MATTPVMRADEEFQAAGAIEHGEIEHWIALLSYVPAAVHVLVLLEGHLATTSEENANVPEIGEMLEIARSATAIHLAGGIESRWALLAARAGRAVRIRDAKRQWMREAHTIARTLATGPMVQNEGGATPQSPIDPGAPAVREYLQRVEHTFAIQRDAKERFIKANLRLVVYLAKRYSRTPLSFSDRIQEGNIGLVTAVHRFDRYRGCRFSTYAFRWVRQAIRHGIAQKGREIGLPIQVLERHRRVERAIQVTRARTGQEPTLEDLERQTGVSRETLFEMKTFHATQPVSLESTTVDDGGLTLLDLLEDEGAISPVDGLTRRGQLHEVERLLGTLTLLESTILRARFGIDGEELFLSDIGKRFGVSGERIRQVQEGAIEKLRRSVAVT